MDVSTDDHKLIGILFYCFILLVEIGGKYGYFTVSNEFSYFVCFGLAVYLIFSLSVSPDYFAFVFLFAAIYVAYVFLYKFGSQRNRVVYSKELEKEKARIHERIDANNVATGFGFVQQERSIPKIIIQTGPANMSPKYAKFVADLKRMNPEYQYMYFDDDDIIEFFSKNYPELLDVYEKLPIFIQKIDFFRYVAVYHYGGIYLDLDMEPLIPFDDALLKHDAVFPVDEYIFRIMSSSHRYRYFVSNDNPYLLGQYAFGARKGDAFIKTLIDDIAKNIDEIVETHGRTMNYEFFVYATTGPDFVTKKYMETKTKPYVMYNGMRQYFGDYMAHRHFGTWK
jgi:mannosyltransferase OCH1-like enzyme